MAARGPGVSRLRLAGAACRLLALPVLAGCAARGAASPGPAHTGPGARGALRAELEAIFSDPVFQNAHWGVVVQSVETGEILYRHNAEKLFMPASNMKLVTAAVALTHLGPDHRFQTRIGANGKILPDGTLDGDLVVVGGGDPAISARFYDGDPLAVFRAWADSLRARGIARIRGNVLGDDDAFDDVHLGPGWAWDYLYEDYAAEIGALLYNEGVVRFRITPGDSVGAAARMEMQPFTRFLRVRNDVVTVADSTGLAIRVERRAFSNDARLSGAIWVRQDSATADVAIHDPTMFFVTVLAETLRGAGIDVAGWPIDRDSLADEPASGARTTLFVHSSPTLAEIVKPFLKVSQNQIGEMLLRTVGAVETDTGSVETGRRVVGRALSGWGIAPQHYIIADGSGLSRYNYLSPEMLVRLLRAMAHRPEFGSYYDALPIAGVDGSLEFRMRGTRAAGNARAKTGFVSNARALSGYVTTLDGELLAFSMLANNFSVPVPAVEYLQDLAVERMANFSRYDRRREPKVSN